LPPAGPHADCAALPEPEFSNTRKAPRLPRYIREAGRLAAGAFQAGRGCKSPTPDHLPLGFRNPHSRAANRRTDTARPRPGLATRRGWHPYPRTTGPRFACAAKAPACAWG
jgi:hypothetical protein